MESEDKKAAEEFRKNYPQRQMLILDAVQNAFLAGIAHKREKHRWISVEERLPTPYASVLACKDNPEMAPIVCYYDDRCGGWLDTIEQNRVGKPTHWMPLPEPPQKP